MRPMSPCKTCDKHDPACHGQCEEYEKYRENLAEYKAKEEGDKSTREYFHIRAKANANRTRHFNKKV